MLLKVLLRVPSEAVTIRGQAQLPPHFHSELDKMHNHYRKTKKYTVNKNKEFFEYES